MRKLILVSLGLLVIFTLIMLTPNICAGEQGNPWVATYDVNDNPQTQFNLGDTVRIKAYSHITPYYIYVYKPDGTPKKTIGPINTASYSGDHNDITTDIGWWTLNVLDTESHMGVGQYFVIPQVPLGVAGVLTACFAGLGVRQLPRKRHACARNNN